MAYNPERNYAPPPNQLTEVASAVINRNKEAATSAAYLEAGRIANNQVSKLALKALPMGVRGFVDTPGGKIVIANLAMAAFAQFRPQEPKLTKLGQAMAAQAFQELIQTVDVEGFIDQMLAGEGVKKALANLPD
jgi:hypothetical protein